MKCRGDEPAVGVQGRDLRSPPGKQRDRLPSSLPPLTSKPLCLRCGSKGLWAPGCDSEGYRLWGPSGLWSPPVNSNEREEAAPEGPRPQFAKENCFPPVSACLCSDCEREEDRLPHFHVDCGSSLDVKWTLSASIEVKNECLFPSIC